MRLLVAQGEREKEKESKQVWTLGFGTSLVQHVSRTTFFSTGRSPQTGKYGRIAMSYRFTVSFHDQWPVASVVSAIPPYFCCFCLDSGVAVWSRGGIVGSGVAWLP